MNKHIGSTSVRDLVAGLLAAATLYALPATAHAEQRLDPQAMAVLEAMSKTLAGAKSLTVRSMALYDVIQPGGIAIKLVQESRVQLKRPNKLYARVRRDDGTRRHLWYDGKSASFYDPNENTYSMLKAPSTLESLFEELSEKHSINVPLADLLNPDPYAAFKKYLISAAYLGKRSVDGVESHHLSFESQGADFQLWVTADDKALPLRFAITYVTEPGEPGFLALLRDWQLTPYIDDGTFEFHPPPGAKKVAFKKAGN
jgi:hypothetical protein